MVARDVCASKDSSSRSLKKESLLSNSGYSAWHCEPSRHAALNLPQSWSNESRIAIACRQYNITICGIVTGFSVIQLASLSLRSLSMRKDWRLATSRCPSLTVGKSSVSRTGVVMFLRILIHLRRLTWSCADNRACGTISLKLGAYIHPASSTGPFISTIQSDIHSHLGQILYIGGHWKYAISTANEPSCVDQGG